MEFFEIANVTQSVMSSIMGDPYYTYYWVCLIIGGVAFLGLYSLEAVALISIAKNNNFKHKWMAFVPIVNTYYIGVLAEKNKTFNKKTKYFSLALAIVEAISVCLGILNSVAIIQLFDTNYVTAIPEPIYNTAGELVYNLFVGYEAENLPASLNWAWWIFTNGNNYIFWLLELVYIVLEVFVLSAFFRTYSPRNYMIFTVLSVLFPIKAIFMLCVKNNKATNYMDYVKEMQKRQYDAYQQYMRNNGGFNPNGGYNQGGYNPNGGYNQGGYNPNGGYNQGGYNGAGQASQPEDPFGGLGEQAGKSSKPADDDPFGDLK
ncbi:MAG: hypothetical protein ACI4VK_01745 [Candidatus Coproplasma sp.]